MADYTEIVNYDIITHCLICGKKLTAVLCRVAWNEPYMQWRSDDELAGGSSSCEHEVS